MRQPSPVPETTKDAAKATAADPGDWQIGDCDGGLARYSSSTFSGSKHETGVVAQSVRFSR